MFYKQMRYFYNDADFNQMEGKQDSLINGEDILNNIQIQKIGIQTLPGTRFCLNSNHKCIVGSSGIWELDLASLNQTIPITQLAFCPQSIANIRDNDDAYLIIDIAYNNA